MNITPQFISCYQDFENYPENLVEVDRHSYLSTLRAYKSRLLGAADKLFVQTENVADVPIRDFDASGAFAGGPNVFDDQKLRSYLGDTITTDPNGMLLGSVATKPDPKCRFIFVWAKSSRSPLKVTRKMLTRLMSYHQIMPRYLEFVFLFGQRTQPHDMRYSGFRAQASLGIPSVGLENLDLQRSGRHYQMCYNLKTVETITPPGTPLKDQAFSIRQAAFYHKFDVVCGTALWMITKASLDIKDRIYEVLDPNGRVEDRSFGTPAEAFRSSLTMHSMYTHWAVNDWRWYVQWLEDTVEQETQSALQGSRTPGTVRKVYTPVDLQDVQIWEEKANEAVMILDANAAVLTAITDYYTALVENPDFPLRVSNRVDVEIFSAQIKDAISDCKMQSARTKLLVEIAAQRKTLILQWLQSQAAEKIEILASMSQKEAIAMRIITVVTLIYLPATFVSTFFSTDVVKYQGQNNTSQQGGSSGYSTSFSSLAMYRWLQVTIPLTILTLVVSYFTYKRARNKLGPLLPLRKS